MCDSGDKFLILGGCGFIGRHLIQYLVEEGKASRIIVIDKTPPEIAWFDGAQLAAIKSPLVSFHTANLISLASCEKVFESIPDDEEVDYVINLAAETRKGQSEPVYKEGIHKLSSNVMQKVKRKWGDSLRLYVEFSSGVVYPSEKAPVKESNRLDPSTSFEAKYKIGVEQELAGCMKNYIIIRSAIVYGPGDQSGITPRLVVGAVYKELKEMMKLPWNADLRMNTVHVRDLVRATYHLCKHGKEGEAYNVVDDGSTTQGKISAMISDIFNINHDYWGTAFTSIARMDMWNVLEDINDKHMTPWASICADNGISNTPLTPYLHSESLSKRHLSLDGSKLRQSGFDHFEFPEMTKEALEEILDNFVQLNMFPPSLLHG